MAFERCNCMTLRRAARRVSHFYDERLAPTGLRATQYSILATLRQVDDISINDLAEHLDLDRTTTSKNLRPLIVAKLVAIARSEADGRSRTVRLTAKGSALLKAAVPLWKRAQEDLEGSNGTTAMRDLRRTLATLVVPA